MQTSTSHRRRGLRYARGLGAALTIGGLTALVWSGVTASAVSAPRVAQITGGACTAPDTSALFKSISTGSDCDNAEHQADYPITGWISVDTAGNTLNVMDGLEALSAHKFYWGQYTLTWGTCTSGSAVDGSYVITEGTGDYPTTPPTKTSGSWPTITGDTSGFAICPYSLTVENAPAVSGTGEDKINSVRNDVWIGDGQVATVSVKPPDLLNPSPSASPSTSPSASASPSPSATPTASASPTATPTGTVSGSSTASTASSGGVQGITTPTTGAGGEPIFLAGLLMLLGGILVLAAAPRLARQED